LSLVHDENHNVGAAQHDFLTARQLAAYLQVSETTVHRLAREGRIPAVRLTPRLVRFHLPSVLEALDGRLGKHNKRRAHTVPDTDDAQLSFEDML
jgi:excisionase family DNA binding protein